MGERVAGVVPGVPVPGVDGPLGVAPAAPDVRTAGLSYIDALYALAFGQIFSVVSRGPAVVSAAAWAQLVVAATLISVSWVGYHNSKMPNLVKIQFFARSFWQLVVDILVVVCYFVLVIDDPGIPSAAGRPGGTPSALPEAALLVVLYLLYLAWDLLEISLRRRPDGSARVPRATLAESEQSRKATTIGLAASAATLAGVLIGAPSGTAGVVAVSGCLMATVLGHRLAARLLLGRVAS